MHAILSYPILSVYLSVSVYPSTYLIWFIVSVVIYSVALTLTAVQWADPLYFAHVCLHTWKLNHESLQAHTDIASFATQNNQRSAWRYGATCCTLHNRIYGFGRWRHVELKARGSQGPNMTRHDVGPIWRNVAKKMFLSSLDFLAQSSLLRKLFHVFFLSLSLSYSCQCPSCNSCGMIFACYCFEFPPLGAHPPTPTYTENELNRQTRSKQPSSHTQCRRRPPNVAVSRHSRMELCPPTARKSDPNFFAHCKCSMEMKKYKKQIYHPKCAKHHENASHPNGFKLWKITRVLIYISTQYFCNRFRTRPKTRPKRGQKIALETPQL